MRRSARKDERQALALGGDIDIERQSEAEARQRLDGFERANVKNGEIEVDRRRVANLLRARRGIPLGQ